MKNLLMKKNPVSYFFENIETKEKQIENLVSGLKIFIHLEGIFPCH